MSLVERSLLCRGTESPEKVRDGTASRIVKLDGRVLAVPHRILAERG